MPLLATLLLAAVLALAQTAPPAAAQVTTDAGASIILFPFVVTEGQRDTVIQIANRSTRVLRARCSYAAAGAGESEEMWFTLQLVSRQATMWVASSGRPIDATDPECSAGDTDCYGAGFDPGRIPALPAGFRGDLVCVQVDRSGAPTSGNALRGVATITTADGDVGKYEAIGVLGVPDNDADNVLCLGDGDSAECPRGAEYSPCPKRWLLGLRAEGAPHSDAAGAPTLHNTLVFGTCSRGAGVNDDANVQISVTNEFEQTLSTSQVVPRWQEVPLADVAIFRFEVAGSEFIQTELRASASGSGVVVLALSDRRSDGGDSIGGSIAMVPQVLEPGAAQDRVVLAEP